MELWNTLRSRLGQVDWRSHAPVAGSIAAHAVVGLAVAAIMAASAKPEIRPVEALPLEVALVFDEPSVEPEVRPAPSVRRAPVAAPQASTDTAPPVAPPKRKEEKAEAQKLAPDAESDGVYAPPSPFASYAPTGGLQGLASLDPCAPSRYGPRPRECSKLGASVGQVASLLPLTKKELEQQHGDFTPKCALASGCEPEEWISTNGTRSTAGTRMAGGVSSVGGITDTVGRLGFNRDHRDRGFGN